MKRILLLVLPTVAFFFFPACGQKSQFPGFTKVDNGGFYFKNHTNKPGNKPKEGELVLLNYSLSHGDSLVIPSNPQQILIPPDASKSKDFFTFSVTNMAIGDSLTTYEPADSVRKQLGNLSPIYKKGEYIKFTFKLVSISSKEEVAKMRAQAEAEQAQNAEAKKGVVARAPEVEKLLQQNAADYKAGKLKNLQTTPEGLKYIIHEQGTGPKPKTGQNVKVQYCGILTDGTKFDSSFDPGRGDPIPFQIGTQGIIPGWNIGVPLLNQGGKATIFIPYNLGYGEGGSPPKIPGKAELIFYIELVDIK